MRFRHLPFARIKSGMMDKEQSNKFQFFLRSKKTCVAIIPFMRFDNILTLRKCDQNKGENSLTQIFRKLS